MKAYKIDVSDGFLLFLCAYACFDPGGSFLSFLLSVFLHELSHLSVMQLLKIPVYQLRFGLSGAVIKAAPMNYRQELLVSGAGPLMNLLLFLSLGERFPMMAMVNMVLLLYNLLPVYPLDGGRLLRALLRSLLPYTVAEVVERGCVLSCMLFVFLAAAYLSFYLKGGLWPILCCAFLFFRLGETFLPKREIYT